MNSITSIRVIDVLEIAGYSHFMNTWYYVCDWLYRNIDYISDEFIENCCDHYANIDELSQQFDMEEEQFINKCITDFEFRQKVIAEIAQALLDGLEANNDKIITYTDNPNLYYVSWIYADPIPTNWSEITVNKNCFI